MKRTYVILMVLLAGCDGGIGSSPVPTNDIPTEFTSNSERIYFTGVSASGKTISSRGGDAAMGMHRQMHGGGCAICHGVERGGAEAYASLLDQSTRFNKRCVIW
jgi:mono/diheme cytochrome c family protein